jgi:methylglutaconyl-CoA hydratase
MSYTTLKLKSDGTIATITLNRPEKRNAISAEMLEELPAALAELERSAVRVVLLTGAGKAFCAGMDLEMLRAIATQPPEAHLADSQRMARLFRTLYEFPRPTIAAVNGPAIAGGCGLATLCDFVLAVPEAQFGYTEVRIGFLPAIVSVFLRRQVGERVALDLLLTGRLLDAAEALRLGLINELVPAERLGDRARELASALLVNSPTSVERTKALLRELARESLERELAVAIRENAAIRATPDFHEGITAFLEKRKPVWRGSA